MPDITYAELERRNRATAQVREIWAGAIALFGAQQHKLHGMPFEECISVSRANWRRLRDLCVMHEPLISEGVGVMGDKSSQSGA